MSQTWQLIEKPNQMNALGTASSQTSEGKTDRRVGGIVADLVNQYLCTPSCTIYSTQFLFGWPVVHDVKSQI